MKKRVLIITNPLNHEGGVVNYYNLFFKYFNSSRFELKHHAVGSRAYLFYCPILKRFLYPIYFLFDVLFYTILLIFDSRIKVVQVSPSLIPVPLVRDGILVLIAKITRKKIIVFYRGWKPETLDLLSQNVNIRKVFNYIFQKGNLQIVLANSFKADLEKLKPANENEILVRKTAIERNSIIANIPQEKPGIRKVLFLARIQNLKGIEELIKAIGLLSKSGKLDDFHFTIAGHEEKLGYIELLKQNLRAEGVPEEKVDFPGRVTGDKKYQLYSKNDIYILPSYTEGCPNSVLEALASGLFCITTSVGALSDIINSSNGKTVPVRDEVAIYNTLLNCPDEMELLKERFLRVNKYSELFDINNTVTNFEHLYYELCEQR